MRGLWTVARQTFAQALRMKVAGVFILLLAMALIALPFLMSGDGTLSGQIRTFLVYSMVVTAALLSRRTRFGPLIRWMGPRVSYAAINTR